MEITKKEFIYYTLELFNVIENNTINNKYNLNTDYGYFHFSNENDLIIEDYFKNNKLNGKELNKTFHKSWDTVKNTSKEILAIHQIMHYISTYGSNFESDVYIPNEILELPQKDNIKLLYINSVNSDDIIEKCLNLLYTGIALKQDTIDKIFKILFYLGYKFTSNDIDSIKNKEALCLVADISNIMPNKPEEFLRYLIFKSTGSTLLIKSNDLLEDIKNSDYNPYEYFIRYDLIKLSQIFNRFKPIFLAFKYKDGTSKIINKISKLSKKYHKPLKENILNKVSIYDLNLYRDILKKAKIFELIKALNSLRNYYLKGKFYLIRNGKSWYKDDYKGHSKFIKTNIEVILKEIKSRTQYNKTVYLPNDIEYNLPTSEKQMIGNIPFGTKFKGDKLIVGVYWENSYGANDIDVSAINVDGKVGWNSEYNRNNLMYSGDITNAPEGAVEYMYSSDEFANSLIMSNIYSGDSNTRYKIVIGKGNDTSYNYMINPDNMFCSIDTNSVQNQTILGLLENNEDDGLNDFTLLNTSLGNRRVSSEDKTLDVIDTLIKKVNNQLNLREFLELIGYNITNNIKEADLDFSLEGLTKNSFIDLLYKY